MEAGNVKTGKPCRGCMAQPDDGYAAAEVSKLLARLEGKVPFATADVYDRRLAACSSCASLLGNHTCRHCGCFVAVRARMKDAHCPEPLGTRWAE